MERLNATVAWWHVGFAGHDPSCFQILGRREGGVLLLRACASTCKPRMKSPGRHSLVDVGRDGSLALLLPIRVDGPVRSCIGHLRHTRHRRRTVAITGGFWRRGAEVNDVARALSLALERHT